MSEKKLTINSNPKEILEAITKNHGIEFIKDFVKAHNKKNRKKSIRVNGYKDISLQIYHLVIHENYSVTRAIDKIALEHDISPYTVARHKQKFDKEAKEFDFYSFCAIAEKYNYRLEPYGDFNDEVEFYSEYANLNKVDAAVFEIYLHKYKNMPTNERKKYKVDYNKFEILQRDKPNIQQQRYYQRQSTNEVPF